MWLLASDFIFLRTQAVHITQQMEGNTQYDTEDIIKWKRKRLFTFIVFCLQYFVSGMVFTMLASTTWYYVVNQLRPKNPYVVYAVMTNLNYLPTVSLSLFTSSWHDKHRRTSLLVAINNYICMIGGIFYSISYSLYFPIFGCALLGARSLVQPIAIGELARSYPPEELTYKLPVVNFFYYLGYGPGSLIAFLLENLKFFIGSLEIQRGNFPGIVMLFLFIILQFLTVFYVHNLSLEFNLKEQVQQEKHASNNIEEIPSLSDQTRSLSEECLDEENVSLIKKETDARGGKPTIASKVKRLLCNIDVLLIYVLAWLFTYIAYLSLYYLPLLIQDTLHYSSQYAEAYNLGFSLILIILLPVITCVKVSSKVSCYIGLLSFVLLILIGLCYKLTNALETKQYNILLLSIAAFLFGIVYTSEDIFLTCTIAKLVKSDIQSFADGMRLLVANCGGALGCLSIALFVEYEDIFYVIILTALLVSIISIIARRVTLINPIAVV